MQNFFFKCFSENSISKIFPLKNCFGNFSKERQNSFFSLFSKHHWCKKNLPDFFILDAKLFSSVFYLKALSFKFFSSKFYFIFSPKFFSWKSFLEIFVREQQKIYRKRKKIRSDPACGDRRIDRMFHSWAPVN